MRYSWTKFAIGLVAGIAALWLFFHAWYVLAVLLLCLSLALTRQKTPSAGAPEPEWSSDREEWRQQGRDLIKGVPEIVLTAAVGVALVYAGTLAVLLQPALADLAKPLALIALTAYWLVHVVLGVTRRRALPRDPQQSAGGVTP